MTSKCYECAGNGVCWLCAGTGSYEDKRCHECGGGRVCIICRGTGHAVQPGVSAPTAEPPPGSQAEPQPDDGLLFARSAAEEFVYTLLHACACGERSFEPRTAASLLPSGRTRERRFGRCPACGSEREFVFSMPEFVPTPKRGSVAFGNGTSKILDPGELMWAAQHFASQVPADPAGLNAGQLHVGKNRLEYAIGLVDETLKFVPPGAVEVPASAIHSAEGARLRLSDPGQFMVVRLEAYGAGLEQLWPLYHPEEHV